MPTEHGFTVDHWSSVGNYAHDDPRSAPGFQWLRRFSVHLPSTAGLVAHFPDNGRLSLLNGKTEPSWRSRNRRNLPLDPRIEVNIAADRSSVAYRRGLRGLGLSQFFTA